MVGYRSAYLNAARDAPEEAVRYAFLLDWSFYGALFFLLGSMCYLFESIPYSLDVIITDGEYSTKYSAKVFGNFNIDGVSSSFLLASSIAGCIAVIILYRTFYNEDDQQNTLDLEKGKKSVTQSMLRGEGSRSHLSIKGSVVGATAR
jgi:hypothetical protein